VIQLYDRIFPKLAAKEHLEVYAWADKEVYELLSVLSELTGCKTVII